ncbi:exopolysaccharide biosynthesis polyprenyl glycosylphosphotransferase [Brevundimonas sp.]|jgi:Undecaprenyl-phosphate glucose phosphotransferase|uniref:exopolysaccharide biosynthesis polyprenyl glycosylphosphotransferase n=1 Tax=Brevundimonas sp. TaxID=1871086 RepID=UPI0037BE40C1
MPDCAPPLAAPPLATPKDRAAQKAERGPFRPEVWLNARQRSSVRLAAHYFRAADVLAVAGLAVTALWLLDAADLNSLTLGAILPLATGAVAILALLRGLGLYRFGRDLAPLIHIACILGAGVLAIGAALLVGLALGRKGLGPVVPWGVAATATLTGLHALWLMLVARWRRQGALSPNIVIVGATRNAEALIERALERRDLNILGVFDDRLARSPDSLGGVPVLGGADALLTHKMAPYIDRIVLAIDAEGGPRVRDLTRKLETLPNPLTVLVDSETGRDAVLTRLASAPLAEIGQGADADRRAFVKRLQDLAIGGMALVVAAPIMAAIALAIRLDSPGPIFFRQRRHGFNQEAIVVWKFRSMRHAAADATASRQVSANDDRVTRVGRFIRATSLDELPQIFNVLTGEMSLVGPRPHAIGMKTGETESALLVAEYAHRHRIKPGMTGWAAIKGSRGPVDTEAEVRRRVELDVDYIQRQSFWLDLWIILITIPVLLGDRAAVR